MVAVVRRETTLRITPSAAEALLADGARRSLLAQPTTRTAPAPNRKSLSQRFRELAFLRVPLFAPDAWLARTVAWVRPLGARPAIFFYLVMACGAVLILAQRIEAFVGTFPFLITPRGALALAAVLVVTKTLHELGHAYVAKAYGTRVASMGVVLILLFPVAYCDVTDSWRLATRRARLGITLAGCAVEAVLASLAVFVWLAAPGGLLGSLCVTVVTGVLITTLLVNLNPAMRFDGYYALSDLLRVDNLHTRATALLRARLHQLFLGLPAQQLEPGLPRLLRATLLAFAIYAWAYRVALYAGIALLLYLKLAKVLGLLCGALAIHALLIEPAIREVSVMRKRIGTRLPTRGWLTVAAVVAILAWAILPLPRRITAPAIVVADQQTVYAPAPAEVAAVFAERGDAVVAGDALIELRAPELAQQRRLAELQRAEAEQLLALGTTQTDQRAQRRVHLERKARADATLATLAAAEQELAQTAAFSGRVVHVADALRTGRYVASGEPLLTLENADSTRLVAYVRDRDAAGCELGTEVVFRSTATGTPVRGVVRFVDDLASPQLAHPALGSQVGGPLAVRSGTRGGGLGFVEARFRIEVELVEPPPNDLRRGATGTVWMRTPARSYGAELWRSLRRAMLRESGF